MDQNENDDITQPDPVEPVEHEEVDPPAPTEGESAAALLASLSDDTPAEDEPAEPVEPKEGEPEEAPKAEAPAEEPKPKTLDEEEAEALEGVRSERGRERIQATFAKLKEVESTKTQMEADINQFKDMVRSTGMAPQEFVQMMEFGRLMNAGDEASAKQALTLLDQQREALCKRLGIEAPGVDVLADFPDLKQAVDNMEITRERAIEFAKYKRAEQQATQQQQSQQAQQEDMQAFQQSIAGAAQTAEAYFDTRKHEVDYAPKMARIQAYFKDPARMQEFVQTYQPNQWFAQFKFMYDNMNVAPQKPATQPLRSRPTGMGAPVANPNMPMEDRLLSHIDSLGL